MRLQSLLLFTFTALAAAAVEREDQYRDFDVLRLETQLGDDVPLDRESQERLVRIARQMGAVVTTETPAHVTRTLPKPSVVTDETDPKEWEFVSPTREDIEPDQLVGERILRPERISLMRAPQAERKAGKPVQKDGVPPRGEPSAEKKFLAGYLKTIKNRIGSLRAVDFPKAEFRSTSSNTEAHNSPQFRAERREDDDPLRERVWAIPSKSTKPLKKSQGKKPERKPSRKKKQPQSSPTSKTSPPTPASMMTSMTINVSSHNKVADEDTPTVVVPSSDSDAAALVSTIPGTAENVELWPIDSTRNKNGSVHDEGSTASDLLANGYDENFLTMDEKTRNILQQLAALNLYQELPVEIGADEDEGRLPLEVDEVHGDEQIRVDEHKDEPVVDQLDESDDVYAKRNSTERMQHSTAFASATTFDHRDRHRLDATPSTTSQVHEATSKSSTASEETSSTVGSQSEEDPLQKLSMTPTETVLQHLDTSGTDKDIAPGRFSTRSPKNLSSSNGSATVNRSGVVSQIVYHKETTRRPSKRVSVRRPTKSEGSKRPAPSTTTTSTTTTSAPASDDDGSFVSLEEFDSDAESTIADDESDPTTKPATAAPTTTTAAVAPRRKSHQSTKKASSTAAAAGGKKLPNGSKVHQRKGDASPTDGASGNVVNSKGQPGSTTSDSVKSVLAATYQMPQVILPPPQLPMNPLAALGNLLPLLQMLNRPTASYYHPSMSQVSQAASGVRNGVVQTEQQQQQQAQHVLKPVQYHQVPYYSFPQYNSPYYFPQIQTQPTANMMTASHMLTNTKATVSPQQAISSLTNANIAWPEKIKTPQKKPSKKPATQPVGAVQQLPNIAATIRAMMHLLNANNAMLNHANPTHNDRKKHRMPKMFDAADSPLAEPKDRIPVRHEIDNDKQHNLTFGAPHWQQQQQQQQQQQLLDKHEQQQIDNNVTQASESAWMPPVDKLAGLTDVNVSAVETEPNSLELTGDGYDPINSEESLLVGMPRLSRLDATVQSSPTIARRMDIDDYDENDAEVLARALGSSTSNYKMLMGLLTGAFSGRREPRGPAKLSRKQVDLEKSRQLANNMIMHSLLYKPPPMYQNVPARVASWPMIAASPPLQRAPVGLMAKRPSASTDRPPFYGKRLAERPRQPRYYTIGGLPREVHDISRFNERGFESEEEAFDTAFPSIPIDRTPYLVERSTPDPMVTQAAAAAAATATARNETPSESFVGDFVQIQTPPSLQADVSSIRGSPSPTRPPSSAQQPTSTTEIPNMSTNLPASVRIVIRTTSTTTQAPSLIKFSNRIGDRRIRRFIKDDIDSLERSAAHSVDVRQDGALVGAHSDSTISERVQTASAVPFFEFVGETLRGSNGSTAPGRNSVSPEEAFLQTDDWAILANSSKAYLDEVESASDPTTSGGPFLHRRSRALASPQVDEISRCFYANTTFSTMLNCNDGYYSCTNAEADGVGCSCNDDCVKFGDCCWDKVSELQREFGSLADIEYSRERLKQLSCVGSNKNQFYFMVSKCAPTQTSESESALCSGSNLGDPLLRVPVTSRTTLVTYKNIACAQCHEDASDLIFWQVEFHCPRELEISSVHRAIDKCPFATNPPGNFSGGQRRLAARPCNPHVDYDVSTDLDCERISANDSATIRAPSRHVADKLSIMCDLIYLPTIDLDFSGCNRAFYRNRFCALCRQRLTEDLRCAVDADMPMPLADSVFRDASNTGLELNLRWQNGNVLCNRHNDIFDPWRKSCRRVARERQALRCRDAGSDFRQTDNPMSYFRIKETWLSYGSVACLTLTLVSYYLRWPSNSNVDSHDASLVDDVVLCLVSSLLGAQILFHVSVARHSCLTRSVCAFLGLALHFCTVSSLAWTNVLLYKVWTGLRYALESVGKRPPTLTFLTPACCYWIYAWTFPAAVVGVAGFAHWILDASDPIAPCYGCQGVCFISNLPAFWLFVGGPLVYVAIINVVRFMKVLQECHRQPEEVMSRCIVALPFRSVIGAVLLVAFVPLSWVLALVAVSLRNERVWLAFLVTYGCHGPMCLLLSGGVLRYARLLRRLLASATNRAHTTARYNAYLTPHACAAAGQRHHRRTVIASSRVCDEPARSGTHFTEDEDALQSDLRVGEPH